jgi:hypothetical protein
MKKTDPILKEDHFLIYVTWKHGFRHIWPCRGYDLKSILTFLRSLTSIDTFEHKKVSEKLYTKTVEVGNYSLK